METPARIHGGYRCGGDSHSVRESGWFSAVKHHISVLVPLLHLTYLMEVEA